MTDLSVALTEEEWRRVTAILEEVPWKIANPILYKIAYQIDPQRVGLRGQRGDGASEPIETPPLRQ